MFKTRIQLNYIANYLTDSVASLSALTSATLLRNRACHSKVWLSAPVRHPKHHKVTLSVVLTAVSSGLLLLSSVGRASTEQVLAECSAASVDERSFSTCLSVALESDETALVILEQQWQRLLDATQITVDDVPDVADPDVADDEPSQTDTDSKVIALVNDNAIAEGVDSGDNDLINIDSLTSDYNKPLVDNNIEATDRFSSLTELFRNFRDQHCALQATLFGTDRIEQYNKACLIDLNRTRTAELKRWLAQQRSVSRGGLSYSGYYLKTDSGATFQACDRKTDWWVMGSNTILEALDRRYTDISSGDFEVMFVHLQGTLTSVPDSGPGADFAAGLQVGKINLLRPLTDGDCTGTRAIQSVVSATPADLSDGEPIASDSESAATVEDFASAGFLYGYFSDWVAACAIVATSVCSAETSALFASDGEWRLRIDRSRESDWRVHVIPTTNDHRIEKALKMQLDGAPVFIEAELQVPAVLELGQGIEVAQGEFARELITRMRTGQQVRFEWRDSDDVMSELKFTLTGVTRALQYFDIPKP